MSDGGAGLRRQRSVGRQWYHEVGECRRLDAPLTSASTGPRRVVRGARSKAPLVPCLQALGIKPNRRVNTEDGRLTVPLSLMNEKLL